MVSCKWQRIDTNPIQFPPRWLEPGDYCYFAREYTPGAGFTESETNDLIVNIKKPVDRKGKREWCWKEDAIKRFAKELSQLLDGNYTVTCVPSSKAKNDPLYDSRIEDTLHLLRQNNPKICIEYPIVRTKSVLAKHKGGVRDPNIECNSLEWVGFQKDHSQIIIVDDVITSGAGFKTCQRIILENISSMQVIGVFWARSIHKDLAVS